MKLIDRDDAWRVAQACAWYTANRNVEQFLAWFFDGEKHESLASRRSDDPYVAGWARLWNTHNFARIFCAMDYTNQRRFVEEILRAYEADSARTLELCEAFSPEKTCGCGFKGTKLGYDMHDCVRMTALAESRAERRERGEHRKGDSNE